MRKEYDVNGKTVVVENGSLIMGGKVASEMVYQHSVREVSDAPKSIRGYIAKNNINIEGRVYVDCPTGAIVPREIAEEAVRQTEEIRKATDPRNVIEGYAEIKAAYADVVRYHQEFNDMMDDEYNDGVNPPKPIAVKPEEIEAKYPRAAAYVEAENYGKASNYDKANSGEKAMKRIIAGENHETVIAEMKTEWLAAAEKAVINN